MLHRKLMLNSITMNITTRSSTYSSGDSIGILGCARSFRCVSTRPERGFRDIINAKWYLSFVSPSPAPSTARTRESIDTSSDNLCHLKLCHFGQMIRTRGFGEYETDCNESPPKLKHGPGPTTGYTLQVSVALELNRARGLTIHSRSLPQL